MSATSRADTYVERRRPTPPLFSICIPQHNRTSFLLEVCRSLEQQAWRDFEVCISDDRSTDGRQAEILDFLHASGLAFVYRVQAVNSRYDANLRSAIELARGEYCFLLGNDDALKDRMTLSGLSEIVRSVPSPAVVFTNFEDYATGRVTQRVPRAAVRGSGPTLAASSFRKFSFVSGVVLATGRAHASATAKWDGSEMYQMYIGTRLIAEGGVLVESDLVTVRKDIQVAGENVDSYARKKDVEARGIPEQRIPLVTNARLVIDALGPHLPRRRFKILLGVLVQYFGLLYPYWLLEYRRVRSWRFAAGVSRAMRPRKSLDRVPLFWRERVCAALLYAVSTVVGLTAPLFLITRLHDTARHVGARIADWSATASS